MKNLANCKPSEFLRQTVRIRRAAETWLKATDIMGIIKRRPVLKQVTLEMSEDDRQAVFEENKRITLDFAKEKFGKIFDEIAEAHPNETLAILALSCFVEPEDVDNYPMSDYLGAFAEMMQNTKVISFFTSLMQLGQMDISIASKR